MVGVECQDPRASFMARTSGATTGKTSGGGGVNDKARSMKAAVE